jgi:hypothetical protein
MPIIPLPLQYDGDDPAFLHNPKFVARPVTTVYFPDAGGAGAIGDVEVPHDLDRVPMGYHVVGLSGNAVVYNGSVGWTAQALTLKASAAGTTATILVF